MREARGEVGFELKVEAFCEVWKARAVVEVVLGTCLITFETANGRRRTNAMM